ncbi:hypothetical protein JCM10908_002249 [Rhodotorula pacifica]|uniref:uncharacterized protein n=1 Tax=Rhodotorula pacifica TaxID=1495444 RepID=UPI00317AC761
MSKGKAAATTGAAAAPPPAKIRKSQQLGHERAGEASATERDRGRPRFHDPTSPTATHRSSFSSSPERDRSARAAAAAALAAATAATTPKRTPKSPFRSLRTRLFGHSGSGQANPPSSSAAGTGSKRRTSSFGGRPAEGSTLAARHSVRGKKVSGPISVVPGGAARLKGYSGPAGSRSNAALTAAAAEAAAGTVGRSVSLPANLARAARGGGDGAGDEADIDEPEGYEQREDDTLRPALLWRGASGADRSIGGGGGGGVAVTEFGALSSGTTGGGGATTPLSRTGVSVDEFLAAQVPMHSPPILATAESTARDRLAVKQTHRSIQIAPRTGGSLSPNAPASITRFLRSPSPDTSQHGGGGSGLSSPSSLVSPPLVPRISSDFVRQSDEPSLSALRARQAAETEAIARTLAARDPSHRNSRILPGATLPNDWTSQTLVRSKTVSGVPDRWRDPYSSPRNGDEDDYSGDGAGGSTSLRRSSSDSPLLPHSDVMLNAIAAAAGTQSENERGFSLGRVAGRRQSLTVKTHNRTISAPVIGNGPRAVPSIRPNSSRPFPSEFEEVPFQQFRSTSSSDDGPLSHTVSAGPTPLPQIVETSPVPTETSGSPVLAGSEASQAAASPLMDMIEQLEGRPTASSETGAGGAGARTETSSDIASPVLRGGAPGTSSASRHLVAHHYGGEDSDAMEHIDDSPFEFRRDRNTSTQSEAGYPFPLAGYLDSAAPSRSGSTDAGQTRPGPPTYLFNVNASNASAVPSARTAAGLSPDSLRSDSESAASPSRAQYLGLDASSGGASHLRSLESPDRSITMEQMEREIAQMEAELTASGTPRTLYDSPYLSSIRSPEREEPDSPSPPGSRVTPRSAKRWSLVEMERAYERMKSLLAASSRDRSNDDGRSPALDSIAEGTSARDATRSPIVTELDATLVHEPEAAKSTVPMDSPILPVLRQRRLGEPDQLDIPLGESGGPLTITPDKPLPGLPARIASPTRKPVPPYQQQPLPFSASLPEPQPVADDGADLPEEFRSFEQRDDAQVSEDHPASLEPPVEIAVAEHAPEADVRQSPSVTGDLAALATEQAAALDTGTLAHRRTGSEGRIRQLYLPLRNQSRRDSMLSTAGIDDMLSELGSPVTEIPPRRESTILSTPPPISPAHDQRLPTSARSSRFSRYELRSGAGRELQRRLGHDSPLATIEPLSPMRRRPMQRIPSRLQKSDNLSESGKPATTNGGSSGSADDAETWFPVSPGRDKVLSSSSDGSEGGGGSVPTGFNRRRSNEKPKGVSARPALNASRVRTMDKLEVYLEYVAIRTDLEKAELERAAVFDALRETRAVLAGVRKQRDQAEKELKILRAAPQPSPAESEASTQAWRDRAQQALFDVEILRHELLESKAREEALLRGRDGAASTANGPVAAMEAPPRLAADSRDSTASPTTSFVSEPSKTGTITMQQVPFPSVERERSFGSHEHGHQEGSPDLPASNRQVQPPSPNSTAGPTRAPKDSLASSVDSQTTSSSAHTGGTNRLSAMFNTDFVSPLMNQTMHFIGFGGNGAAGGRRRSSDTNGHGDGGRVGKSSAESRVSEASPLKVRSSGGGPTASSSPTMMGRSFSALGFPGAGAAAAAVTAQQSTDREDARAGAKVSTGTASSSEFTTSTADRSIDSSTLVEGIPAGGGGGEGGVGKRLLRERDEAFLSDLTTKNENAAAEGEESRGHRPMMHFFGGPAAAGHL